ncbi:MAG: DUF4157 domain-containing protein [Cyanobacteria bacterium J06635_11]
MLHRNGGADGGEVSNAFESELSSTFGGGQPMAAPVREPIEQAMGAKLGHLRVHTGPKAAELTSQVQAKAMAVGNNLYFNEGQYKPHTPDGLELAAHEIAHTFQTGSSQQDMMAQRQTDETIIRRNTEPAKRIATPIQGNGGKESSKFSTIQKGVVSYNHRVDEYNKLLGKKSTMSSGMFDEQKKEALEDLDQLLQKIADTVLQYLNKRKKGIDESVGLFTGSDKKKKILANRQKKLDSIKALNAELINITKDLAKHKNPQQSDQTVDTNTSDTVEVNSKETQDVEESQQVVIKIVSEVNQEKQLESQLIGSQQSFSEDSDSEDSVSQVDLGNLYSQDESEDNGVQDESSTDEMTYLYQDITGSNPCLWMNWNNPNIRIVSSSNPGQGFEYFNQVCAYLSVYWLANGRPKSLGFNSLDDGGKKLAVNTVCELLSNPAQAKFAMNKIGGQQVDPKTVKQKIADGSYAAGTAIWYGNPLHAQALYVDGPGSYINYDPDLGTHMFINAKEWLNWVNKDKRGAVDVCVVKEA